jgi:hypothetical protein
MDAWFLIMSGFVLESNPFGTTLLQAALMTIISQE